MFKYIQRSVVNFMADKFGIPQTALNFIKPMQIAGRQTKIGLPKDLISLNVLNLVRGVFNRILFASHLNWVWPYWVVRQYDSKSLDFIPRGFQIPSMNVANRNWTGIGNLYHTKEAIIDPRGLITPWINSFSYDVWAVHKEKLYAPSRLNQVKQRVLNSVPVIETAFDVLDFRITLTTFAQLIRDRDVIFHHVNVTNFGDTGNEISIYFSIRPYNPEGASLIHKVGYQNQQFSANGSLAATLIQEPSVVHCSNLKEGDVSLFLERGNFEPRHEAKCDAGLCTACAGYSFYLNPLEEKELEFRIPMDKNIVIPVESYFSGDYEEYKGHSLNEWRTKLKEGLKLSIPDKKMEKAFKTNMSYLMLLYDGNCITPGPFNYHHFWFRDSAYLVPSLIKCGYIQEAKRVIETYPSRQKFKGFFFSQQSEWDSNGQAIYTIAEYYRVTKDKEFLRKLIPSVEAGAKWIIRKLQTTFSQDVPYKGLMPVGLSAEHFGANDVFYWDDYWSLKGLQDALFLIHQLSDEKIDTRLIEEAIQQLKVNIDLSLEIANEKFDKPYLPIAPSRYMDSAAIGSLAVIYPLRIFEPDDIRLVNTMEYLEENCFTNGAYFHDINHSGHNPYLNMHIAQVYLAQRDPKATDIIQWILDIATHTFTWPESIHPFTHGGVVGDGHHGWAAADFLMAIRNTMFVEEDDLLVLTPVIPKDWISLFEEIRIEDAPSYFGQITFKYEVKQHQIIEIEIQNEYDHPPKAIEINLPVTVSRIQIGDSVQKINAQRFLISPDTRKITVFYE